MFSGAGILASVFWHADLSIGRGDSFLLTLLFLLHIGFLCWFSYFVRTHMPAWMRDGYTGLVQSIAFEWDFRRRDRLEKRIFKRLRAQGLSAPEARKQSRFHVGLASRDARLIREKLRAEGVHVFAAHKKAWRHAADAKFAEVNGLAREWDAAHPR